MGYGGAALFWLGWRNAKRLATWVAGLFPFESGREPRRLGCRDGGLNPVMDSGGFRPWLALS